MSVYERVHETGLPIAKSDGPADDEWDTDPDFVNDVSEKKQRYGSVLIQPIKAEMLNEETPNLTAMAKRAQDINNEAALEEYNKKKTLYGGN